MNIAEKIARDHQCYSLWESTLDSCEEESLCGEYAGIRHEDGSVRAVKYSKGDYTIYAFAKDASVQFKPII